MLCRKKAEKVFMKEVAAMKLSDKQKKVFIIAGCVVLGVCLVLAIGWQLRGTPSQEDVLPEQQTEETEILVDLNRGQESKTVEAEEEREEAVDSLPTQTDETEQDLQAAPEKPEAPSEDVLTDPTQKPDGEAVETAPVPVEHEDVTRPEEVSAASDEPQGGDTKEGQIYVPGFGWIDEIGEGQGTVAEDMYENGNKIGIMD